MQLNLQAQAVGVVLVKVIIDHIFMNPCVLKPGDTFVECSAYRMVPFFKLGGGDSYVISSVSQCDRQLLVNSLFHTTEIAYVAA